MLPDVRSSKEHSTYVRRGEVGIFLVCRWAFAVWEAWVHLRVMVRSVWKRSPADVETPRPSRRALPSERVEDYASQLALMVSVYGLVVYQALFSGGLAPTTAAEVVWAGDPAEHAFEFVADEAPHWCVRSLDELAYAASPCAPDVFLPWRFRASNLERRAIGENPCWWTATYLDLQRIRGITESTAMLAVKARQAEQRMLLPLELAESLGEGRARRLHANVSLDCALEAR